MHLFLHFSGKGDSLLGGDPPQPVLELSAQLGPFLGTGLFPAFPQGAPLVLAHLRHQGQGLGEEAA